jgi:hypothetical protein
VWPQDVVVEPVLALIASKQMEQSIFAFGCFERGTYLYWLDLFQFYFTHRDPLQRRAQQEQL